MVVLPTDHHSKDGSTPSTLSDKNPIVGDITPREAIQNRLCQSIDTIRKNGIDRGRENTISYIESLRLISLDKISYIRKDWLMGSEEYELLISDTSSFICRDNPSCHEKCDHLLIATSECCFMNIRIICTWVLRDHEESDLFGGSEVLWFSSEIIYCRGLESIIEMTKSNTAHISGQYFFFREHVVQSDSIERFEHLVSEVALIIDPEDISDILRGERRSSFDDGSCLDIVHHTANNSLHADAIIVPEISVFKPNNSARIDSRNIAILEFTVSDTLMSYDLPNLDAMNISNHHRVWK